MIKHSVLSIPERYCFLKFYANVLNSLLRQRAVSYTHLDVYKRQVTRLYEKLLASPVEQLDVEGCCKIWLEWGDLGKNAVEIFQNTDFLDTAITQSKEKYISKEELAVQLEKLKAIWPELKEKLKNQLVPSEKLEESLRLVGAPVAPVSYTHLP